MTLRRSTPTPALAWRRRLAQPRILRHHAFVHSGAPPGARPIATTPAITAGIARTIAAALVALALVAPAGRARAALWDPPPPPLAPVRLVPVISHGLDRPVHLVAPRGDRRLFIVERGGRIRIARDGQLVDRPFLDLSAKVSQGFERGLLSVAFHPRYAENGWFYVDYTDVHGDTRIERYRVSSDPDRADPASAALLIGVGQPYANHNGGHLLFDPDGKLWIALGDGGSGGDPQNRAQNRRTLLGKLLRIDVDRGTPYAIPRDNPFVSDSTARPEIWAYGLRNPWRIAIDPVTRQLVVADVGQNAWEEIDVVPLGRGGFDFGWNVMEGSHCFGDPRCDRSGRVPPVFEYPHREGCSITGGVVYRGAAIPWLVGRYLYGDFCRGWIETQRLDAGRLSDRRRIAAPGGLDLSSFGVDGAGEAYVVALDGRVFRLAPAPGGP